MGAMPSLPKDGSTPPASGLQAGNHLHKRQGQARPCPQEAWRCMTLSASPPAIAPLRLDWLRACWRADAHPPRKV
eukprot:3985572-Pyramimonas_sp.AAC.1